MSAAFATVVPQLREQIDELSEAIEAQKLVLQSLIQKRSEAQTQLNSFLDPMARLPVEIQSEIFLLCVEKPNFDDPHPHTQSTPILLLHVCRLWRDIASLCTPRLWTAIVIDLPRRVQDTHYSQLCDEWIDRARTLPLSPTLIGISEDNTGDLMLRCGPQVEELVVLSFHSDEPPATRGLYWGHEICNLLIPGNFPMLRSLCITAGEPIFLDSMAGWMDILRAAPNLSRCQFTDLFLHYNQGITQPIPSLTLAHLRELRLGSPSRTEHNTAKILEYLTLPALETLCVTSFDMTEQEFINFLARSSPRLRSLELDVPKCPPQAMAHLLVETFRQIPHLADLTLVYSWVDPNSESDPFGIFIHNLGSTEDLTKLENLTIWHTNIKSVDCRGLAHALEARFAIQPSRTPFHSFRLLCDPDSCHKPYNQLDAVNSDPFFPVLRQLMRDGNHAIHVGTTSDNFLARTNEIS
ncbi:hypothetical protein R3P38DRAFT_3058108 [Favolaschia claudopus]|uniref:F-box domain-containing protein n=1 Tax=Favolaschia claudopus TaxID=2862362 RepID=A0AAW0A2S1_9AGAR